jgi:vacuolar-type H+-ATPase subunit H
VSDGLEVLKDHIIRTENLLKSQIESVFEEVTKAVRKAHKEAVPAVKSFLEPMYSICAAERGQ